MRPNRREEGSLLGLKGAIVHGIIHHGHSETPLLFKLERACIWIFGVLTHEILLINFVIINFSFLFSSFIIDLQLLGFCSRIPRLNSRLRFGADFDL